MDNKVYIFDRALHWIYKNTLNNKGITVTSRERFVYPEVTGYYIPTLLNWGEKQLALSYAEYLCSIQKDDGSWCDYAGRNPYIFDSAQILKGLLAIRDIMPEADTHIIKGCDWILTHLNPEGRLIPGATDIWGEDENFCSELVHTYCLTPLAKTAKIYNKPEYHDAAIRIKEYYIKNYKDKILHFSLLSHFYAYVMEGLLDMGEEDLIRQAMNNMEVFRLKGGGLPGLKDVEWVCSTGLFQLALVWYKLGELEKGNQLFDYACSLQNKTGGWYGSYPTSVLNRFARGRKKAYYFPKAEISWANKYFLDALSWKTKLEFEEMSSIFIDEIDIQDGRYQLVLKILKILAADNNVPLSICDVGCGKGRYLKNLISEMPEHCYCATDISENVMKNITGVKEKKIGNLTSIPYEDERFDYVYVCEALEHALNIKASIQECLRILRPKGMLLIIDKPVEKLGKLQIQDWERWIDDKQIREIASEAGAKIDIVQSVPYEGKDDGLFRAWILQKN